MYDYNRWIKHSNISLCKNVNSNRISLQTVDINECGGLPCLNGGSCINKNGGFVCDCPTGYIGNTCDLGKSWLKWCRV